MVTFLFSRKKPILAVHSLLTLELKNLALKNQQVDNKVSNLMPELKLTNKNNKISCNLFFN